MAPLRELFKSLLSYAGRPGEVVCKTLQEPVFRGWMREQGLEIDIDDRSLPAGRGVRVLDLLQQVAEEEALAGEPRPPQHHRSPRRAELRERAPLLIGAVHIEAPVIRRTWRRDGEIDG